MEYYNLFSLASQHRKKELANYEWFNCTKYCEMLKHTDLGQKVTGFSEEACHSLDSATRKFEGEVEARMRRIRMSDKVSKVSDSVKKMKDRVKALYREKAGKVKAKLGGLVQDARDSSKGIRGRIKAKMSRFRQRMQEFYHERTVGPSSSYSCVGHQMRNFVLSSVLLQHLAFTVLLWRHWDKSEAVQLPLGHQLGLLATVGTYWVFALISMFARLSVPQWISYSLMSIALVHMEPFQIVTFDFLLLLLTIALATISVFDIYHRLYKGFLVLERAVLQDHLFMALQVTLLFLHLSSAPIVVLLTLLMTVYTWRDFVSFFQLQRGQSIFSQALQLVQTQIHQWIGIALANICWIIVVRLTAELPFSLLHKHLNAAIPIPSLGLLAAEMTLIHCCILIKYKIRYSTEEDEGEEEEEYDAPGLTGEEQGGVGAEEDDAVQPLLPQQQQQQQQQNIPIPPPLPPHFIALHHRQQQQRREAQAQAKSRSDATSMALLHPTVYWHYVWILGVFCDLLMGLLDRLGFDGISQSLSLVLPIIVLVAVLPVQLHYWNNKWNYDISDCPVDNDPNHLHHRHHHRHHFHHLQHHNHGHHHQPHGLRRQPANA